MDVKTGIGITKFALVAQLTGFKSTTSAFQSVINVKLSIQIMEIVFHAIEDITLSLEIVLFKILLLSLTLIKDVMIGTGMIESVCLALICGILMNKENAHLLVIYVNLQILMEIV